MNEFDYEGRRRRLLQAMDRAGLAAAFIPLSADLEYLTGLQRRLPTFGDIGYAHDWVAGMLLGPDRGTVVVLPRMMVEFDLPAGVPGDLVVVSELDDGPGTFAAAAARFGQVGRLGIGSRTRGDTTIRLLEVFKGPQLETISPIINEMRRIKEPEELRMMTRAAEVVDGVMARVAPFVRVGVTERELAEEIDHQMAGLGSRIPSFDTGVWTIGPGLGRDADVRLSGRSIPPGAAVSFDFGAVIEGYCSDFGRTIHVGEPSPDFVAAYDLVIQAQRAGIAAAVPGATAGEVHRACRDIIVAGGEGEWFRHRTGHCIGLDVHERPYISEEDKTELAPGMTFTIEPSIFHPDVVGTRVEDVIACEPAGSRKLNVYPTDLVVND